MASCGRAGPLVLPDLSCPPWLQQARGVEPPGGKAGPCVPRPEPRREGTLHHPPSAAEASRPPALPSHAWTPTDARGLEGGEQPRLAVSWPASVLRPTLPGCPLPEPRWTPPHRQAPAEPPEELLTQRQRLLPVPKNVSSRRPRWLLKYTQVLAWVGLGGKRQEDRARSWTASQPRMGLGSQ